MSEREPRFRYRLDPLARVRAGERDALKVEAGRAAREVELRTIELREIDGRIERAVADLRTLRGRGEALAPDAELRALRYLAARRGDFQRKQLELEQARLTQAGLLSRLELKQRDTKVLERHLERKRREFDLARTRSASRAADDQWLLGQGRREKK